MDWLPRVYPVMSLHRPCLYLLCSVQVGILLNQAIISCELHFQKRKIVIATGGVGVIFRLRRCVQSFIQKFIDGRGY